MKDYSEELSREFPHVNFALGSTVPDFSLSVPCVYIAVKYLRGKTTPSKASAGIAEDCTIFYGPECEATLMDEQVEFFREVQDPDGDFRAGHEAINNSYDFKTPLNLAIADSVGNWTVRRQTVVRWHSSQS